MSPDGMFRAIGTFQPLSPDLNSPVILNSQFIFIQHTSSGMLCNVYDIGFRVGLNPMAMTSSDLGDFVLATYYILNDLKTSNMLILFYYDDEIVRPAARYFKINTLC